MSDSISISNSTSLQPCPTRIINENHEEKMPLITESSDSEKNLAHSLENNKIHLAQKIVEEQKLIDHLRKKIINSVQYWSPALSTFKKSPENTSSRSDTLYSGEQHIKIIKKIENLIQEDEIEEVLEETIDSIDENIVRRWHLNCDQLYELAFTKANLLLLKSEILEDFDDRVVALKDAITLLTICDYSSKTLDEAYEALIQEHFAEASLLPCKWKIQELISAAAMIVKSVEAQVDRKKKLKLHSYLEQSENLFKESFQTINMESAYTLLLAAKTLVNTALMNYTGTVEDRIKLMEKTQTIFKKINREIEQVKQELSFEMNL